MKEIAVLLWLVVCAWLDWKHREVPNWLVLFPLPIVLVIRLFDRSPFPWLPTVLFSLLVLAGWCCHWIGGADVKGTWIMALFDPRLALYAWSGACAWYLLSRLSTRNCQQSPRLPGFMGFLVGVSFYCLTP